MTTGDGAMVACTKSFTLSVLAVRLSPFALPRAPAFLQIAVTQYTRSDDVRESIIGVAGSDYKKFEDFEMAEQYWQEICGHGTMRQVQNAPHPRYVCSSTCITSLLLHHQLFGYSKVPYSDPLSRKPTLRINTKKIYLNGVDTPPDYLSSTIRTDDLPPWLWSPVPEDDRCVAVSDDEAYVHPSERWVEEMEEEFRRNTQRPAPLLRDIDLAHADC